ELAVVVESPAPEGAVGLARAAVPQPERDLGHGPAERAHPVLHRGCLGPEESVAELAVVVESPAPECAVSLARAAVPIPECDLGHGAAERARAGLHCCCAATDASIAELAVVVESPAPKCAVGLARAAVLIPERDVDRQLAVGQAALSGLAWI